MVFTDKSPSRLFWAGLGVAFCLLIDSRGLDLGVALCRSIDTGHRSTKRARGKVWLLCFCTFQFIAHGMWDGGLTNFILLP